MKHLHKFKIIVWVNLLFWRGAGLAVPHLLRPLQAFAPLSLAFVGGHGACNTEAVASDLDPFTARNNHRRVVKTELDSMNL
jgi:hypothetical protein